MEYLTNSVDYEEILASDGGKYVYRDEKADKILETPCVEVCGLTKELAIMSPVENLAALHYFHWND